MTRTSLDLLLTDLPISWKYTLVAIFVVLAYFNIRKRYPNLDHIPVVGFNTPFESLNYILGVFLSIKGTFALVERGYHQHGVFRVATLHDGWAVVVSGRGYLEDLKKAPEDTLSFVQFVDELLQISTIVGKNVVEVPYHMPIVKSQITRSVGTLFSEISDETALAFEENLDLHGDDWKTIHAQTLVHRVVARAANRLYVGLPTCRSQEYTDHAIGFVNSTVLCVQLLRFFPESVKPIILKLFTNIPKHKAGIRKHLQPIIEARQQLIKEHGYDYPDKPNDILSYLMDIAEGEEQSAANLTLRILVLNLVAVLTTSMAFLQTLYNLAAHPEVVQPLREELQEVLSREGWNKAAMSKLTKMDSFLKETQRMASLSYDMGRKVLKSYTFSDGLTIPAGAHLFVATGPTHADTSIYGEDAKEFVPFRFINDPKSRLVTTTPEYLIFGHGPHACPGRFFAASELKLMLAHVLMHYDVKLVEDDDVRPPNLYFGHACVPDPTVKLRFRKRADLC